MEKAALGLDFLREFQCFYADYHSTNAPFPHLLSRVGTKDSFAATVLKDCCLTPPQDKKKTTFKA
jgi:hypothetical protein